MLRGETASLREAEALKLRTARLSGTDMPDDYHPPMPRHDPERVDLGRIQSDLEFLIERGLEAPDSSGVGATTALCDRGSAGPSANFGIQLTATFVNAIPLRMMNHLEGESSPVWVVAPACLERTLTGHLSS